MPRGLDFRQPTAFRGPHNDPNSSSQPRPAVAAHGSGRRGHSPDRRGRSSLHRCLGRRRGVLPRARPSTGARSDAPATRRDCLRAHEFFHDRGGRGARRALDRRSAGGIAHVYLVSRRLRSDGSRAQDWRASISSRSGSRSARHFIARRQSYHGNTLGALAVGGNAWRRAQFAPLLIETTHVSPCYEYRDRAPQETPEAYSQRLVRELETAIERLGPGNVIAFVAETVGRRDRRRRAADAGLLSPRARVVRPPRHPADPGRSDVRHGPHRHAARLRTGRRRARSA